MVSTLKKILTSVNTKTTKIRQKWGKIVFQKCPFWGPKGFLLHCERGSFGNLMCYDGVITCVFRSASFYFAISFCQNLLLFSLHIYAFSDENNVFGCRSTTCCVRKESIPKYAVNPYKIKYSLAPSSYPSHPYEFIFFSSRIKPNPPTIVKST